MIRVKINCMWNWIYFWKWNITGHDSMCTELRWLMRAVRTKGTSAPQLAEVRMKFSRWFMIGVSDIRRPAPHPARHSARPLPARPPLFRRTDRRQTRWAELMMWMNQVTSGSDTDSHLRLAAAAATVGVQLRVAISQRPSVSAAGDVFDTRSANWCIRYFDVREIGSIDSP